MIFLLRLPSVSLHPGALAGRPVLADGVVRCSVAVDRLQEQLLGAAAIQQGQLQKPGRLDMDWWTVMGQSNWEKQHINDIRDR